MIKQRCHQFKPLHYTLSAEMNVDTPNCILSKSVEHQNIFFHHCTSDVLYTAFTPPPSPSPLPPPTPLLPSSPSPTQETHTYVYQLRVYLYQARDMYGGDKSGLSGEQDGLSSVTQELVVVGVAAILEGYNNP